MVSGKDSLQPPVDLLRLLSVECEAIAVYAERGGGK